MHPLHHILSRRSIRRYQQKPIPLDDLQKLADAGRLAATGGNRQPWEFILVQQKDLVEKIFPCLAWLAGDGDPPPGMEPAAYLIVLGDPHRSAHWQSDCAAATQNICVAANALDLGSCWLGSVRWEKISKILQIPDYLEGFAVVSLGYPAQEVAVESGEERLPKRDAQGVLRLPKRPRGSVVHVDGYG